MGLDPCCWRFFCRSYCRGWEIGPFEPARCQRHDLLPVLPRRGHGDSQKIPPRDGGRIVNGAARPALEWRSGAGMAAYAASKAAVAALTVALAEEVAKDGVLVNAVAPSILDTPANRNAMPKADHAVWPKVEDVAQT